MSYLGPYSTPSGGTAYVEADTLLGFIAATQSNGNPSTVIYSIGASDGIELDVEYVAFVDAVLAAGRDVTEIPDVTGVPWSLVRGAPIACVIGTSDENTSTTVLELGGASVSFLGTPADLRTALEAPTPAPPSSPLVLVQGIVLDDGSTPFAENFEVSPHVPGSGLYHIGLTEEAAGTTGVPCITPFGGPLTAGTLGFSYAPTGPGEFDVFVRDAAGLPADAPFGFSMVVRPVA